MADLNTNSLYQMIQDQATQADGIRTAAVNAPTFESQFGNTLREQDKTLSGAVSNYSDKVAEMFAHDKYVADNWSTSNVPTNLQPEGFIEDPYAKAKSSANLYAQKGAEVAGSLKTLETRKAVLGDLVDKAMKMYEAGVQGKRDEYAASKDKFAQALDLLQFEETKRKNKADEALTASTINEGKTAKERLRNDNLRQLKTDAAAGTNLVDIMTAYAKELDQSDIIEAYKESTPFSKNLDESPSTLNTMYRAAKNGVNAYDLVSTITNKQVATNIAAEAEVAATSARLSNLSGGEKSYFEAISKGEFPAAQKLFAKFGKDSELYAQLNAFAAVVTKDYYGSAFTQTEKDMAKQWIENPTSMTGNQLAKAILSHNTMANEKIATYLRAAGIVDQKTIDSYIKQIKGNVSDWKSSSSTSGKTSSGYSYSVEEIN